MSAEKVKLSQFQPKDKQAVIELLLQNDNVLMFLHEKLFPVTTFSSSNLAPETSCFKNKLQNQSNVMLAGSKLSLLTQKGLDKANLGIIGRENEMGTLPDGFLPGSKLGLNPYQRDHIEKEYYLATNYARKSFGGNTQMKYKVMPD